MSLDLGPRNWSSGFTSHELGKRVAGKMSMIEYRLFGHLDTLEGDIAAGRNWA
jgi:hypothetical protein